uniref:UDENN domain-containing protein n=1 Tax=Attheya septentrionalis TaxID=420275 RepID=A0A7S2UGK4_9STRA
MPEKEVDEILEEADALWREKLSNYDFAFNLAYTPNSPNLLNDNENANVAAVASGKSKRNLLAGLNLSVEPNGQSRWDKVQEAFLRFYVTILRGYRKFLVRPENMGETDQEHTAKKNRPRWNEQCTFRMEDFLETRAENLHGFLTELCSTQQFSDFITKRLYYPGEPDVIFFDQSIDAKRNRSKLQMRKTETPFLQSAQAHKVLNTLHAIEPNAEDVPSLEKQAPYVDAGSDDNTLGKYMYTTWPAELNPELYGIPRPTPKIINAEFDRRSALSAQLRSISIRDGFDDEDEYWELYAADCSASPEVAAFTLFINAYTAMTGIDLIKFEKKRQQMGMGIIRSPGDQNSQSTLTEADPDSLFANLDFSYNPYSKQQEEVKGIVDDQQNGGSSTDYEEMRAVAKAQLDLAFETLKMIKKRGLRADPDSYKCLIEACGRCGNVRRATQLMEIIRSEHLIGDAEMYSYFMQAFSSWNPSDIPTGEKNNELEAAMARLPDQFSPANTSGPQTPDKSFPPSHNYWNFLNGTNGSEQDASFTPSSNNTSDAGSVSETASSLSDDNAKKLGLSSLSKGSVKKKGRPSSLKGSIRNLGLGHSRTGSLVVTLQKKKDLLITEAVLKQVNLGETILEFVYSDIQIDTSSDACPKCSRCLKEDDIIRGWKPREFRDYTTACPQCTHRFVPRFSVRCSSASFEGSQGKGSPLYCEYLSPWVMRKEMRSLIDGEGGIEAILDPEWRSGTGINATLWWNMVVCFLRYRLPITFLLEGNFPNNRLIMPTPESDS